MARQATGDGPVGRIVVARQRERALQIFEHASDLLGGFAWQTLCRASSLASAELGGTHNGSPSQFLPAPATRCGRLALQWGRPALHGDSDAATLGVKVYLRLASCPDGVNSPLAISRT
ncbi:hypothetical protein MJO28_000369 [Puccinia striiformis f. sp. tritici]|uniref:Uncharacterized protein n=1 Tax=Puccinia striiformis f. sp. tritici TaxID=168172 RepID=A0ACC0EZF5_9BASI|nr:hypothetical protein MJO28_000369 [Puccinia striiformis f. sp. tritici]